MKYVVVIMVAVAALVGAVPASAQLVAHHEKHAPLPIVESSQKQNLAHSQYVCNNGANYAKWWACHAVQWLTKELKQTEAVLHPVVTAPQASGYAPLCGSSCVRCESTYNPQAVSKNGKYWGWYQFDFATWVGAGGIASHYGNAPAAEQTAIASRLHYDAWPNC